MGTLQAAQTIAAVALFVVGVLLIYIVALNGKLAHAQARLDGWEDHQSRRMELKLRQLAEAQWKEAYLGELRLHDETRDVLAELVLAQDDYARNLKALQTAHAELQAAFLEQGKQLTIAEAFARAAERISA